LLLKEYDDSYEKDVLDLFEDVFSRKLSRDYWKWRLNEYGKSIRYIMIDEKKVVGHYVVHPIPLDVFGEKIKALFSMSVMTHPKFRGRGIFPSLAKEIYKKAFSAGYEIIFGFPNKNSAFHHFNKLGWKNYGKIPEYTKRIEPSLFIEKKGKCVIKEITPDDKIIDVIWNENKENYSIIVPRTSKYIKWRFFLQPTQIFPNLSNSFYKIFVVMKNEIPKAYFILKYFNFKKSHIVDLFGDLDNDVLYSIISYALQFSLEQKSDYLSFSPGNINSIEIQKICNALGFSKSESTAYFGTKILSLESDFSLNEWYLTMSDSDIF
jgi:predicted acetyltransferase